MDLLDIGAFVDTFLDEEKAGARRLIQHEMESMLDPLVESLFGQLKAKFLVYLDATYVSNGFHREHTNVHHSQLLQNAHTIDTNSQLNSCKHLEPPLMSIKQEVEDACAKMDEHVTDDEQMIGDGHCKAMIMNTKAHSHSTSWQNAHLIDANSQINSTILLETPHMDEVNDFVNAQFELKQNEDSANSPAHESSQFTRSMTLSTSTDESFSDTEMRQQQQQLDQHHNHNANFDDDCVDGDQQIDDQESSPPLKRPRMDTSQPIKGPQSRVTRQSAKISNLKQTHKPTEVNNPNSKEASVQSSNGQPTAPNSSSTHDKQIHTVSVQCAYCLKSFADVNQLNQHMLDRYSIATFRCAVKDCDHSCDNKHILGDHIKQAHSSTTQWHCNKCSKHFTKYQLLSNHNTLYHQLGHFQCSFPSCTFTGKCKAKVFSHYTHKHKPKQAQLNCEQCNYQTFVFGNLKRHQRSHLGIKPYRCKWPKCRFAATQQTNTIRHIEQMHFAPISSLSSNEAKLGDPKDYLEVRADLL